MRYGAKQSGAKSHSALLGARLRTKCDIVKLLGSRRDDHLFLLNIKNLTGKHLPRSFHALQPAQGFHDRVLAPAKVIIQTAVLGV